MTIRQFQRSKRIFNTDKRSNPQKRYNSSILYEYEVYSNYIKCKPIEILKCIKMYPSLMILRDITLFW